MEIKRTRKGAIHFSGVDPMFLAILAEAPNAANPGEDGRARDRLFPDPAPPEEKKLNQEWKELVQPGLRELFEEASETLRRDLSTVISADEQMEFTVPARHIDAWLNCLNRARLVLAERFDFGEREMASGFPAAPVEPKEFALFQTHLYGMIQETIIALIQEEGEEASGADESGGGTV